MNLVEHRAPPVYVDELVINWHITEACNYSCTYCYAKWDSAHRTRDVFHDMQAVRALLSDLRQFFDPDNPDNPLRASMRWRALRLSIAGGEPMLYADKMLQMMQIARDLGFSVSLITNGSLLPVDMGLLASTLSVLGVSIDSADFATSALIGRRDRKGSTVSLNDIVQRIATARAANPRLQVKINTVVNAHNQHEDMHVMLAQLQPDRWKVLRVLPLVDASLAISAADFSAFVARHTAYDAIMAPEDNEVMTETYIMIDPLGRFFQNAPLQNLRPYRYSAPIGEVGVANAFSAIRFSAAGFAGRYVPIVTADARMMVNHMPS